MRVLKDLSKDELINLKKECYAKQHKIELDVLGAPYGTSYCIGDHEKRKLEARGWYELSAIIAEINHILINDGHLLS